MDNVNTTLIKKSLDEIISMVNEGNADAMNELGARYSIGIGVKKDEKKAFELYNKASEKNCIKAKYNLAISYYRGRGVKKNKMLSLKILTELTEKYNYEKAFFYLGYIYYVGDPVEVDHKKALSYFNKALEMNPKDFNAKYFLGEMYMFGRGITANPQKAKMYFEEILDENHDDTYYKLALLYSGDFGIEKNEEKAKEYFSKIEYDLCMTMIYYILAVKPDNEQNLDELLKLLTSEINNVKHDIMHFPDKHPAKIYHKKLLYLDNSEYNDIIERLKNKIIVCNKEDNLSDTFFSLSSDNEVIELAKYIIEFPESKFKK